MNISPSLEREEKFKWSEVSRGVFNVQVWLTATAYFAILAGLYSFGLFVSCISMPLGLSGLLTIDKAPHHHQRHAYHLGP